MTRCWAVAIKNGWQDSSVALGNLPEVNKKKKLKKNTQYNYNKLRPKKICGFAVTQASLPKITDQNFFSQESAKNYRRPFQKFLCIFSYNNFLHLSTKKSDICIFCVPFNAIEMV